MVPIHGSVEISEWESSGNHDWFPDKVTGYNGDSRDVRYVHWKEYFTWILQLGDTHGETTRVGTWTKAELMNGLSSEQYLDRLLQDQKINSRFEMCSEIARFAGRFPVAL